MPDGIKLSEFVAWCEKNITGDEKGHAQIFLDRLFQAFGQPGCLDVGGQTEFRIRKSGEDGGGTAFADYVWKPVVLMEMKRRGTDLQKHYRQAFDYWSRLVPNRPRYVVLCNFDEFRVYDFDTDLDTPKDTLALKDLPARWGPLAFLAPGSPKPTFEHDREKVTRAAADCLAGCFRKLVKRGVPQPVAQRFILQMLVALFAEDIDLLPKYFVTQILEDCSTPASAYDLIGGLFEAMNTDPPKSGGRFKGVSYFNGGLFREPSRLEILDNELVLLRQAAAFDWSKVQPEVFGTLFQHSMDAKERHAFGAEFTHPSDIMKIVGPTIVAPWREQIEGARTLKRLRELLHRLHQFRVLDPACGCGNFLYIAYRELKRLEARIYERMAEFASQAEPGQMRLSFLSAQNFYGLDIQPFAVEIAKVTMMIARKLAIDELHITEPALPFGNLDQNFIAADALLTPEGLSAQWPQADVIIGNPPYLGSRYLAKEHGYEYARKVHALFPDVPKMADYCVYWFRKAHDHLPACTADDSVAGRAGLVGTKTIRQNESREASLDYIVKNGGTITEAVSKQVWSGEAAVHVSIVNWAKGEQNGKKRIFTQIGDNVVSDRICEEVDHIGPTLTTDTDASEARLLSVNQNPKCVYVGQYPFNEGFWLNPEEATKLLKKHPDHRDILFPYMIGRDLVDAGQPGRWIIDFGQRDMLEAIRYTAAFERVKELVMPVVLAKGESEKKATGKDSTRWSRLSKRWWQLRDYQPGTMAAISRVPRYVACSRVTKRPIFEFISQTIHPDNTLVVFPFADDYSFGVLQSEAHWIWFISRCSTLGGTFRYTSDTVFDTFPWPQFVVAPSAGRREIFVESPAKNRPSSVGATSSEYVAPDGAKSKSTTASYNDSAPDGAAPKNAMLSRDAIAKIDAVAAAAQRLRRVRAGAMPKIKGGLRALYRTLELPGANPLKDAHAALDAAVLAAYGFSAKKDLLAQLLALNQAVAARIEQGIPVTAPGVPPNYPDAKKLVTEDCIHPL